MTHPPFRHPAFRHLPRDGLIRSPQRPHHLFTNIPGGSGG